MMPRSLHWKLQNFSLKSVLIRAAESGLRRIPFFINNQLVEFWGIEGEKKHKTCLSITGLDKICKQIHKDNCEDLTKARDNELNERDERRLCRSG